jgi:hypothetical protein
MLFWLERRLTNRWTAQGPGSNPAGMVEQAAKINCLRQSFSIGPERSVGRYTAVHLSR